MSTLQIANNTLKTDKFEIYFRIPQEIDVCQSMIYQLGSVSDSFNGVMTADFKDYFNVKVARFDKPRYGDTNCDETLYTIKISDGESTSVILKRSQINEIIKFLNSIKPTLIDFVLITHNKICIGKRECPVFQINAECPENKESSCVECWKKLNNNETFEVKVSLQKSNGIIKAYNKLENSENGIPVPSEIYVDYTYHIGTKSHTKMVFTKKEFMKILEKLHRFHHKNCDCDF